ncbi:hypothetical protein [Persephonella sp.]
MNIFLEGFLQDINFETEEIEKFLEEYYTVNQILEIDEEKYENVLLNYGTEDLKFATGFLTAIYQNIDKKSYKVIDPIFDTVESKTEYDLAIFFGNRIIEKYNESSPEDYLIRIYTLRRVLNILMIKEDKYFFTKYLLEFARQSKEFVTRNISYIEESYKIATFFYQLMYVYNLTIQGDKEKAFGYLLKDINLREYLIQNNILNFPYENNLFHVINFVGLYFQLRDSLVIIPVDIEEYIYKFLKELKKIKIFLDKNPHKKRYFINYELKKYMTEFLTNIYVAGYEEYYREIISLFPEIITSDHKVTIKILDLMKEDNIETQKEEITKLKNEIEMLFNNMTKEKKERILYLFYNLCVNVYFEDQNKLLYIKDEVENQIKRYKFSLLKIPLFRVCNFIGQKEKAEKLAKEIKEELVIKGNESLVKAIEKYIDEEF